VIKVGFSQTQIEFFAANEQRVLDVAADDVPNDESVAMNVLKRIDKKFTSL
jgi:hypothetical protein